MTCPARETLVPFALGGDDPTIARHVAACPACGTEVAQLREAVSSLRSLTLQEQHIETPICLDEMTIADFVDGRLRTEARASAVTHLLTCARCRSVVRAAGALRADATRLSEAARQRAPRRRWLLPLAAAAVLLIGVWPRKAPDRSATSLREATLASTVAPVPIAPSGSVTRVDRLVWSSVPGAEGYRVRLYSAEGFVLWTRETTDTLTVLPRDSVALEPLTAYFWRVEAETDFRRWVASDLIAFRIATSR